MAEYDVNSIISNIIDVNENTWSPLDKIPLINKEIENLKSDTKTYLRDSDFDIAAILAEAKELWVESRVLVDEMEACKSEIENETMAEILKSLESHDRLSEELASINFALNIVYDVLQCGRYVKDFDEGREAQSFTRAVEAVSDMLQYIETPAEGFEKLDLYVNTKRTAESILDNLLRDLFQEWDRMFTYASKPGTRKTEITITITLDESLIALDVLSALHKSKQLNLKVGDFAVFLLNEVLKPMLHHDCSVYPETEEIVHIMIHYKQNYKPSYDNVISNLRVLLNFLSSKLSVEFITYHSIMLELGNMISVEFLDLFINECLVETVPNNINEMQTYGRITSEIEEFQRFLSMVKFYPKVKNYSLLKYVNDIDVLFADKSSQYFLETARTIMLKDLSVTMSIGVEHIPEAPCIPRRPENEKYEDDEREALDILEKTIPKSLFYFPRCMISKTAQELLDLVYSVMDQAVQCSDVVCKKLYYTARLIFEMYDAVVPYHHENYLQTIPQYVALFHNNCMYLAHNMQTLGHKWLSMMEGREPHYSISFVDLVQKMRELGYKHLTIHMQQQRKQILDNIRSSDLNCIVVKDVLGENAEAAIRQCLRQLQLLKNVWIGVFPINVFTRLMATLLNMFVEELIHRVCTVEDISMELATQLTEMYTLVVQKAPQLFKDSSHVEEHVHCWIKLQELIFVLKGSLKEIDNHWNDGTGPLAIHFTTEEIRNLIKALFQNTQFRANLLSKIK